MTRKQKKDIRPYRPKRTSSGMKNKRIYIVQCALIFSLLVFSYIPSFNSAFHFDDFINITENPYIRILDFSLSKIKSAMVQDGKQNRPLSNLSFAINFYFNKDQPFGYHIVNFTIHFLCTLLVWIILLILFKRAGFEKQKSELAGFLSALLWGVHPIHTQAVTYVVQRQTLMSALFYLSAIIFYHLARVGSNKAQKKIYYLLCFFSGILAFASKEIAISLPFAIFFYELYFFQNLSFEFIKRHKITIIITSILFIGLSSLYLRPEMFQKLKESYQSYPFNLWERVMTEWRVVLWYITLLVFPLPSRLSLEHSFSISRSFFSPITTFLSFVLLILIIIIAIWYSKIIPLLGFGILWYFLELAPESTFIPLELTNEHRLYLASVPLISTIASVGIFLSSRPRRIVLFFIPLVLIYSVLSYERNYVWQDPLVLWKDNVKKAPDFFRPWNNLCARLTQIGEYEKALLACSKALSLNPELPDPHSNKGIALYNLGNAEGALSEFKLAIKYDPKHSPAYFNLGEFYRLEGNNTLAIEYFDKAVQTNPRNVSALYNLATLYRELKKPELALAPYLKAIQLRPEDQELYIGIAKALMDLNDFEKALGYIEFGLKLGENQKLRELKDECLGELKSKMP